VGLRIYIYIVGISRCNLLSIHWINILELCSDETLSQLEALIELTVFCV
jgi:transcriptional regulatory protein LevR